MVPKIDPTLQSPGELQNLLKPLLHSQRVDLVWGVAWAVKYFKGPPIPPGDSNVQTVWEPLL